MYVETGGITFVVLPVTGKNWREKQGTGGGCHTFTFHYIWRFFHQSDEKPHTLYGIDNHFQYHLNNYNDQTDYAALTAARQ
ncbi:hypothetical protein ABC733_10020 [Mangrovibacter sp. SLW1]